MSNLDLSSLLAEYSALAAELNRRQRINLLRTGGFALPKFRPLLEPQTYKGAYGGRGSGKSYFFADLHLHYALERFEGYRALCLRQVQKSIRESLKRLLEERVHYWGVGDKFSIFETKIETPGDGEFAFHGLQDHTAESIKSFEGFHVADIEEGQTIRQRALDLLVPTIIRKSGAEIWARWNPRNETDPIDKFFRGAARPQNATVIEVGWQDNPYVSAEMRSQIEADYQSDPEKAAHIWGGGYEIISEGAYFARHLAQAEKAGRIGDYPFDPEREVITAWDIGVDDYTAIWFVQTDGKTARVIDYYEAGGDGAEQIVFDALPETLADPEIRAQALAATERPQLYNYEKHFLPHDVKVREWGGGARERRFVLADLGVKNIVVGVQRKPEERINAVRAILPLTYFDSNERVRHGLKRLRSYRRKWNESLATFQGPLHDESSHAADAFGEFAINCGLRAPAPEPPKPPRDKYARRTEDDDEGSWLIA